MRLFEFWLKYFAITLSILIVLCVALKCTEASAQSYKVSWVAETKIGDRPTNIGLLGEGAVVFADYLCNISQVELLSGEEVGEYRAMFCGEHQEYMIHVTCLLDDEMHTLVSPSASTMMMVWDSERKLSVPVYLTLRCVVSSEPNDTNSLLISL